MPGNFTALSEIIAAPERKQPADLIEIFFDIETLVYEPFSAYVLGYQIEDGPVNTIHGADCCLAFVVMVHAIARDFPKKDIRVYGFNAYKFDYIYLLPHILELWPDQTILIGTPTDIKMLHSANVKWEDLRALLGNAGSLRGFAESFHLEIQKGELDFAKIKDMAAATFYRSEIETYLVKDVALLPLILDAFREKLQELIAPRTFNLADFTTSLSTFTLKRYLHFFTEPEAVSLFQSVPHSRREYFRSSYHGGRVFVPNVAVNVCREDRFLAGKYTGAQEHINHLPVAYH